MFLLHPVGRKKKNLQGADQHFMVKFLFYLILAIWLFRYWE